MGKYALLLGGADLDKRGGNKDFAPEMYARYAEWLDSLRQSGQYITSHKLKDHTGARLTLRGGQVVEGPFLETKEAIGGVYLIEANSLEEAVTLAKICPILVLQNGYIEVRLVDEVIPHGNMH
jgi:hypothetical protein